MSAVVGRAKSRPPGLRPFSSYPGPRRQFPALLTSQNQIAGAKGIAAPVGSPPPVEGRAVSQFWARCCGFDVFEGMGSTAIGHGNRPAWRIRSCFGVRVPLVDGPQDLSGPGRPSLTYIASTAKTRCSIFRSLGRTADTTAAYPVFLTDDDLQVWKRRDALAGEQLVPGRQRRQSAKVRLRTRPDQVLVVDFASRKFRGGIGNLSGPGSDRYPAPTACQTSHFLRQRPRRRLRRATLCESWPAKLRAAGISRGGTR